MGRTSEVVKITNKVVEQAKPVMIDGKLRQKLLFDERLKGFGVCIGQGSKTFFAQRRVDGRIVREKIDLFGRITTEQARARATTWLHHMGLPAEERQKSAATTLTLRKAWELYQQHLMAKARSPTTLKSYDAAIRLYFAPWLDRPLASITRGEAQAHHQQLAKDIAAGKYAPEGRARKGRDGKPTANHALSVFRLIYNRAMKQHRELPVCPTINVDWFETTKPRTSISGKELRSWWEAVDKIANPVRRDLLKFLLTTGLRRGSAERMKWEGGDSDNWVDFEHRLLHLHDVKGGEKHAFALPLTQWHIDLLRARKQANELIAPRSRWVWPSLASGAGHVTEPWTELAGVSHHTLHDLRRTFATIGEACEISPYALASILNHTQPRGITGGYIKHDPERLRIPMTQIVERILALAESEPPAEVVPIRRRAR